MVCAASLKMSEERAKKLQKAASGLAPVPVSKQERDYLPGTGVYVGDVTTSNWKKEADKVTHYALRCDGFDPSTFYAFTVDTHGAMNPRGRDLETRQDGGGQCGGAGSCSTQVVGDRRHGHHPHLRGVAKEQR